MLSFFVRAHTRWALWLGGQPAKRVVAVAACVFCTWVLLDVFVLRFTSGVSRPTYDLMVRSRLLVAAPDPRILVIDVDEASLKRMAPEFGRWPWPRDTLATVLDYLEAQQPAAIVWDMQFSDADRISPGGDAAFDAAVKRSPHSHFSVARLMAATDHASQISSAVLPALWVAPGPAAAPQTATVSLIPPALPSIAASRLGYNNGVVDADGVLRRYRPFEVLPDGSAIQSIAMSVLSATDPAAYRHALERMQGMGASADPHAELIAWRSAAGAYAHLPFADVFDAADGGLARQALPSLQGKFLIIGSTAASLHDIHPTPISPSQPGVDSLATVLDDALNAHHIRELPRWADALLAIVLCLALTGWAQRRKMAAMAELTLVLPLALLLLSYITLNGTGFFVDLNLAAALVLLYLAFLAYWNQQRRIYWCALPAAAQGDLRVWPLQGKSPWFEPQLDHLIDLLEAHSSQCRIVVPDVHLSPFQQLRWPELAMRAAIVGPEAELVPMQQRFAAAVAHLATAGTTTGRLPQGASRQQVAEAASSAWARPDTDHSEGNSICSG